MTDIKKRPDEYMSIRQLGRTLGLNLTKLHRYYIEGMPGVTEGSRGIPARIHVPTVFEWIVEREVLRRIDSFRSEIEMVRSDKARLLKAQADQRELVVLRMNRELLPKSEVASSFRKVFAILRQSVMELPGRNASKFSHMSSAGQIRKIQYDECVRIMGICADCIAEYCDIDDELPEKDDT